MNGVELGRSTEPQQLNDFDYCCTVMVSEIKERKQVFMAFTSAFIVFVKGAAE